MLQQLVQTLVLHEQQVLKLNLRLGLQGALKLLLQQAELVQKAVQQLHLVRTQAQTPVSMWERIQSWGQVLILGLPLLADLLQLLQHQLPCQLPQDWKQAHLRVLGMLQTRLGMLQALIEALQAPPGMQQALVLQKSLGSQHVGMMPDQSLLAPLCANTMWNF